MLIKAKEKQKITYKRICIRLSVDFPAETLQPRRKWQDRFKEMKWNPQQKLFYPARISFKFDRKSKGFTDKQQR